MNWRTFFALLARDAHVARRNFVPLLLQTFLQPMMFVFIFGRVMVSSGYMPAAYKSLLLPGIMAISMVFTGVWAVAMPLIAEFQFTREIEDRLLAPIEISWLAIEKVIFRHAASDRRWTVVIPAAWLLLRPGVDLNSAFSAEFCLRYAARGAFLSLRRLGPRLQHQPDSHRPDVQHGFDPDDFFRMHVLSLERVSSFSHSSESRLHQSSRVRQRGPARNARAPISAPAGAGCPDRVDYFRRGISGSGSPSVPPKSR